MKMKTAVVPSPQIHWAEGDDPPVDFSPMSLWVDATMTPCLTVGCVRVERTKNPEKISRGLVLAVQARTRWLVHAHLCQVLGCVDFSLKNKIRKNNGASNSSLCSVLRSILFKAPDAICGVSSWEGQHVIILSYLDPELRCTTLSFLFPQSLACYTLWGLNTALITPVPPPCPMQYLECDSGSKLSGHMGKICIIFIMFEVSIEMAHVAGHT